MTKGDFYTGLNNNMWQFGFMIENFRWIIERIHGQKDHLAKETGPGSHYSLKWGIPTPARPNFI